MKVKNKTKHFVWKSLNQVLPVNSLIYERDGKGDPWCRCCGEKIETVEHTLLTCRLAQEVWRIAPIQWDDIEDCKHCLWKWWQKLPGARKRKEGDKHIQLTAYILWHIWKNRNQVVFQADKTEAVYLVHRAVNEWMKFEECNSEGNGAIKSETMETIQERENGLEDQTEMNISTSFCIDKINRRIGCCIIAMSHEKQLQFVWAASKKRNADQLMDLAMLLAAEKRRKKISVQTPNKKVVEKLGEGCTKDSKCSTTLENIHLSTLFQTCLFRVTDSRMNDSVSKIAKFAQKLKTVVIWEKSFPTWILNGFMS